MSDKCAKGYGEFICDYDKLKQENETQKRIMEQQSFDFRLEYGRCKKLQAEIKELKDKGTVEMLEKLVKTRPHTGIRIIDTHGAIDIFRTRMKTEGKILETVGSGKTLAEAINQAGEKLREKGGGE